MEYIMGYNIKKENFENRCNLLVDKLMKATKSEIQIKSTDIIVETMGDKVREIRNKHFHMLFQFMIEDIYVDDICEHELYYDWLFSYICRVFSICNLEEFILECDGFFSYLAIYEIIEILKEKAEENPQLKSYIKSKVFIELENVYKEIRDVFSMNLDKTYPIDRPMSSYYEKLPSWTMYMNWNYDGYDRLEGKGTNWEELNNKYFIQSLINKISEEILEFDGCKELSEDLKELKNSILPENTFKIKDREETSRNPSKNQMRIDLPQALEILAEARTKEMMNLNKIYETVGERIKDLIESGAELSNDEEKIKNSIITTMNREQALGEILSVYLSDENIFNPNDMRMPTHIIFNTLEEWLDNQDFKEDSEGTDEEIRKHNIFCQKRTMSIELVLNRIKDSIERKSENIELKNLDEALNFLEHVRNMEISYMEEVTELKNIEEDESKIEGLGLEIMHSMLREMALRKVSLELSNSSKFDYIDDGIIEIEKAIHILKGWLDEPIVMEDDEYAEFCKKRNQAIIMILENLDELDKLRINFSNENNQDINDEFCIEDNIYEIFNDLISESKDINETMHELSNNVKEIGVTNDYSIKSLDKLLVYFSQKKSNDWIYKYNLDKNTINIRNNTTVSVIAYLGEVIKRQSNNAFKWFTYREALSKNLIKAEKTYKNMLIINDGYSDIYPIEDILKVYNLRLSNTEVIFFVKTLCSRYTDIEVEINYNYFGNIKFKGSVFVITGNFKSDIEFVKKCIVQKGGILKEATTKDTNYIIVGSYGSPNWTYGNAGGKKIDKAEEYIRRGHDIKIIPEYLINNCLDID